MSNINPPSSYIWHQSITPEVRKRSELFLEPTSDHDVILVVGRDRVRIHASSAVLATNSELLRDELLHKNDKGEVHLPDISDPYAFCVFISLLHPVGGRTEDIKDAEIALRLLPLFKLYKLKKRLDECERILIQKQRQLGDLHIAKEYQLRKLECKALEWIVEQDYSCITKHEDWNGIDHNTRYKVFELMLKHKEKQQKDLEIKDKKRQKETERAQEEEDKKLEELEKKNIQYSSFIFDIRDLIKGRTKTIKAEIEGRHTCRHGGRVSHTCGTDKDCKECLSYIVRNVDNIYEYYRREYPEK